MLTLDKSDIHYKIDTDLKTWLENQANSFGLSATDFLIKVIKDLKTGRLIDANTSKESREETKINETIRKTDMYIQKSKSEIARNLADTDLKRALITKIEKQNITLPKSVEEMKQLVQRSDYSKNPIEKDGLRCIDCGHTFVCNMKDEKDISLNIENYMNHIYSKHRKQLKMEEEVRLYELKERFRNM